MASYFHGRRQSVLSKTGVALMASGEQLALTDWVPCLMDSEKDKAWRWKAVLATREDLR